MAYDMLILYLQTEIDTLTTNMDDLKDAPMKSPTSIPRWEILF